MPPITAAFMRKIGICPRGRSKPVGSVTAEICQMAKAMLLPRRQMAGRAYPNFRRSLMVATAGRDEPIMAQDRPRFDGLLPRRTLPSSHRHGEDGEERFRTTTQLAWRAAGDGGSTDPCPPPGPVWPPDRTPPGA